jgi:hypothetical protein
MTPLRVTSLERFSADELLATLRRVRLVGFDRAPVYAAATLEVVPAMPTDDLAPAQRYVLRPNVARILELRDALSDDGVDVFALDGGLWVTTSAAPTERIPVLPPVVEASLEADGRTVLLINDGIHRVYAARSLGLPITVVAVRGASHPYYAEAEPAGWAAVQELDELPDRFVKKSYRLPDGYRALFRDFNDLFPGVQATRKASNPGHLRR